MTTQNRSLLVRISALDKEILTAAAAHAGVSLSTLVRQASLARANRILGKSERKGGPDPRRFSRSQALTYLRSLAREARRGGFSRHLKVGYEVARFTPLLLGKRRERTAALRQLQGLARADDLAGIHGWYDRLLPAIAKLVPAWRRDEFAGGVRSAWASGDAMLRPLGRSADST